MSWTHFLAIIVKVKVVPLPIVETKDIVPPISSQSRRDIESPSPEPPNFRVIEVSKDVNMTLIMNH